MRSGSSVCLNMIVKNEAAILGRCLASVAPFVDACVICDTGSTDGTVGLIEAFLAKRGIAGEVHSIPFFHFEQARGQALELCRQSRLDFDYILLLDADMELRLEDSAVKEVLTAPLYLVRQTNTISYYNPRLLRRDTPARYVGVTHEYLHAEAPGQRLAGLWLYDHACGASRVDKHARDIRLLTEGLKKEPDNARYAFYLAQSYRESGRYEEAIAWYRKRVALGGWDEEVWFSKWMIGQCYQRLGDEARLVESYLEAHAQRPWRREPLHSLAGYYREAGRFEEAMSLCELAETIPYPEGDSLFIQDHVYSTGIWHEMSVAGYYCASAARKEKGRRCCMSLMTAREASPEVRCTALANSYYYHRSARELFAGYRVKQIRVPGGEDLLATNPSVWIDAGGVYCVVRCVNYRLDERNGLVYHSLDPEGVYRTENYLLELDGQLEPRGRARMEDLADGPEKYPFPVKGFEDCRLFRCRGRFWCTCTVRDRNPGGTCEIALLSLDEPGNVTEVTPLRGIHSELHQKNWVPLVWGEDLYLVYSTDPTVVFRYDFARRRLALVQSSEPGPCLEHFRGSSQAVRVQGGWLYLVHESQLVGRTTRFYQHRFVLLDEGLTVQGFSEPFHFLGRGVEFCAGLARDPARGALVASFGSRDREAYLAILDEQSVLGQVRPVSFWQS